MDLPEINMIIDQIQKDIFIDIDAYTSKGENVVFFHGCNAQGEMGAGIARIVKEKWPEQVFHPYQSHCSQTADRNLVGKVLWTPVGEHLMVANGITQRWYGRRGGGNASTSGPMCPSN